MARRKRINQKAAEARQMSSLLNGFEATKPEFLADLEWLMEQRDRGAFIGIADYRRKVLGDRLDKMILLMILPLLWRSAPCNISPGHRGGQTCH